MSDESENRPRKVGRPVAVGVLLFLAWQYGVGLWRLGHRSGGMESKFSRLAVEEHRDYLIEQNLFVLVAYLLIGLAAWLILVPLVSAISRNWKAGPGWRELALGIVSSGLLHGYFMFRLVHSRPYFTGDAEFGNWYYKILELPSESLQPLINGLVFVVLPWVGLAGVLLWWWIGSGKTGRVFMILLFFGVLGLSNLKPAQAGVGAQAGSGENPMNVLIIGSDSLRGDRLGYAGYRPDRSDGDAGAGVSPVIDHWASGATIFDECRTSIGSTLESSISMMSSTYPHTHGIRQMFATRAQLEEMEGRVTTLAALYREQGYDTAAIGDWCAGFYEIAPLGFEEVDVSSFDNFRIYLSQAVILSHFIVPIYFDNPLGYALFPQIRSFAQFVTPEVVTERVEERLASQAASGRPFFWHVFYSSNHLPYRAAEPYCRMFSDPEYDGKNATGVDFDIDDFIGGTDVEDKWSALPQSEVRQIRALYDGCTRQFDECFRRIMEALEKQGLANNTIVVLTSDHGDDLYESGVTLGHGLSFNGSGHSLHTPMAIRIPGREGQRFEEQVRTIDIAPTLAELAGLAIPETWEGRSLVPWMNDPGAAHDLPYYGETQFPFIQLRVDGVERPKLPPMDELTFIDPGFNFQFVLKPEYQEQLIEAKQRCLRTRDWKLVCTPAVDGSRHFRLFHTASDADCVKDVAADHPDILAPMRAALERWVDERVETPIDEIFPQGEGS